MARTFEAFALDFVWIDYAWFLWNRSKNVRARLLRLNGYRIEPGQEIRGWHPHRHIRDMMWQGPNMSVAIFIAKFGRAAYHALPPEAFLRQGKRRAIKGYWLIQNRPPETCNA